MKTKIIKIKSSKHLGARIKGEGVFRISGPCKITGERKTIHFNGTRKEAADEASRLLISEPSWQGGNNE